MKKIMVDVNITEDVGNESRMVLVFDENNVGGLYKALDEASEKIQKELKRVGLVTDEGIPCTDIPHYMEQFKPIVDNAEVILGKLTDVLEEVRGSELEYKSILEDMLENTIKESMSTIRKYRNMFHAVERECEDEKD